MEEQKDKSNKTSNRIIMLAKIVLIAVLAATSVMFVLSLFKTGIVSGLIMAIVIIVLTTVLAACIIQLIIRKRASVVAQIACTILSIICIVGICFAMSYTGAFNGFINKVTELKAEKKNYSLIVMETSGYDDLVDLEQKNIGFLKTDKNAGTAESYLQTQIKFNTSLYDDIDVLLEVLKNRLSDAIVLETDRVESIKEATDETFRGTKIIYSFEIEIEEEDRKIVSKNVTEEPFIVYLSGSDSRNGVKATARSDVNIVIVVNPKEAKMLLISIPRDTYVQLHDTVGIKDKLTHAGVYGINMSKATIEDFLGITINYTVKVSFDTVIKVVDQLDGIEIDSDTAMTLKTLDGKTCEFKVGGQHVDGDCALRFARERKTYQTGDRHRGENQQQVIASIVNKLSSSRDYVLKVPAILDIAADSFETSLSREEIIDFVRLQLQEQPKWKTESIAINGTGTMLPTYSMGYNLPLYVMIPDESTIANAESKIAEYLGETKEQPAENE